MDKGAHGVLASRRRMKLVKRLTWATAVIGLCFVSYLLGGWQNNTNTSFSSATSGTFIKNDVVCNSMVTNVSSSPSSKAGLDFDAHHALASDDTGKDGDFEVCDMMYSEYTPCEDQKRSLKFNRDRLIYRERHCPAKNEQMRCLIPAPPGYKNPFKWPRSRDYAWFANVPHKELTVEKAIQNWVQVIGDKFKFPGGGTMFPRGADAYINDINKLIPLTDGSIRTAVDTGCGVASWGAYLLRRNILAMSFAPRDTHEAQVQFALERGVPAMIGIMASKRLPYPSRAFDMAHCSRCLIPWKDYEGQYLMEVDRILRPGGYWVLSGPPINWKTYWKGWQRTKEDLKDEQDAIESVALNLCWKKLAESKDLAIWQKPINHLECLKNKETYKITPFCQNLDPDSAWYTELETCITPLPDVNDSDEVAGGALMNWPDRLTAVPPRISSGSVPGVGAVKFIEDNKLWKARVSNYKRIIKPLTQGRFRNIMDMNARLGGFAANLVKDPVWVMNVVPFDAQPSTLGVIYERGLIGTYHNWCEAFSTYPRTYDMIHASGVFGMYDNRCEFVDMLIEMDRILRPEGTVIIRDSVDVLVRIQDLTRKMRWKSDMFDHESGPFNQEKILIAVKSYWTDSSSNNTSQSL